MRPAARRPQPRRCRPCLASAPATAIEDVEARDRRRARICRARAGSEIARCSRHRQQDGPKPGGAACATRCRSTGAAQVDEYLGVFLTDEQDAAQDGCDQEFRRQQPGDRAAVRGRDDLASPPLIEKRRAVITRDRTEALLHIATAAAANYRREKQERGLLDYDDLIDKTLAMLNQRVRRLGALQARPRRRSCADRRGAGYQPAAMGHRRAHHFRIHRRPGRARRRRRAPCSRSATRSSRSSRFRARRPANSTERRGELQKKFKDAGLKFESDLVHLFVPLGRRRSCNRSITCSGDRSDLPQHPCRKRPIRCIEALTDAGPSLIELWELAEADDKQGHRGLARAVRRRVGDEPRGEACRDASRPRSSGWSTSGTMTGHAATAGRCAMATCWCWCAGAATLSTP